MKFNKIMGELKAATAPHVFRSLNASTGINWEKPFTIEIVSGNYTVKKLEKEAAAAGYDTRKDLVFILTKDAGSRYERECNLVLIENGAANIERIYNSIYTNAGKYYSEPYSHYFRKGDFEATRKAATAKTFLIMQAAENISIKGGKRRGSFPTDERYKLMKEVKHGDGRGNTYTGALELIRTTDHGSIAKYEANPGRYINASKMWKPESAAEMIDKSGYLLHEHREDLKRRAEQRRREKAIAAYKATDDAAKVEEIRGMIANMKAAIIKRLEAAESYDEISAVHTMIDRYPDGLTWIVNKFETYEEKTAAKSYTSIDAAESRYTELKKALEKWQPAPEALESIAENMRAGFGRIAAAAATGTAETARA